MRELRMMLGLMALVSIWGCPHAFGRGGTLERAAHRDVEEMLDDEECPPQEHLKAYCDAQPDPEECHARCGEK